ncbi:MAG: ABC transporter permease subunit [Acidimicrobiia bacterium]
MRVPLAIVSVALRRSLGGKRPFLALLTAVPLIRLLAAGEEPAFTVFHESMAFLMILVHPIICLVLGAATLGDDKRHETLSILITKPIRRGVIVAAKMSGSVVATLILMAPASLVLIAFSGGSAERWDTAAPLAVLLLLNTIGYVGIFAPLGYVFARAVFAGLAYILIWEASISFVEGLAPASIWRIGMSAYVSMVDGVPADVSEILGSVAPGAGGAAAKAVAVAAAGGLMLTAMLMRRDLAGSTAG